MSSFRFSRRTAWSTDPNFLHLAVGARRARGEELLDLTASNPTIVGFDYPADELFRALAPPGSLRYEPEPLGLSAAREAVAGYYTGKNAPVDPARIVITASTSEAYGYLFQLCADAGDEILVPAPSYPLFSFLADLAGVRLVPYPLRYDGTWHVDIPAARDAITERTRAIVVVSPNNPTGSYLKRAELAALRALGREHGVAILADEVFADYPLCADPERVETLAGEAETLAFSLSGLSKIAALPQLKLGWIVVSGPETEATRALERLAFVADTYLSVATPVQRALGEILRIAPALTSQIARRTANNLRALRSWIPTAKAVSLLSVEGGWYATLRLPAVQPEMRWALSFVERGVVVHPGQFFGFSTEAFVIVSLIAPEGVFKEAISRIAEVVACTLVLASVGNAGVGTKLPK